MYRMKIWTRFRSWSARPERGNGDDVSAELRVESFFDSCCCSDHCSTAEAPICGIAALGAGCGSSVCGNQSGPESDDAHMGVQDPAALRSCEIIVACRRPGFRFC